MRKLIFLFAFFLNISLLFGQNELATPLLFLPDNGTEGLFTDFSFEWSFVNAADFYILQVSTNENFSLPLTLDIWGISANNYFPNIYFNHATTYYWRVMAYNENDTSFWSDTWYFIMGECNPSWNVITTNNYSNIVISQNGVDLSELGRNILPGDAIGIFYLTENDETQCGGFGIYNGVDFNISAYGDNENTSIKDGFSVGEPYTFKIWDSYNCMEYDAYAMYESGYSTYQSNVVSYISFLTIIVPPCCFDYNIFLNSGWNTISIFINPNETNIEELLSGISDNLVVMKNGNGELYIPEYGIDLLHNWDINDGYQVYMSNPDSLTITGNIIDPANTPINLNTGWNLISYLRNTPMEIEQALAGISNYIIVVKDSYGSIYLPAWGINLIGNMQPGQGYQVYMSEGAVLTYPGN